MMKPKGINMFRSDVMKSENNSEMVKEIQAKPEDYIKYQDSNVNNENYL